MISFNPISDPKEYKAILKQVIFGAESFKSGVHDDGVGNLYWT